MKSIFVIVSVVALMYLGAQTKTFSAWWESAFLPPSLQNQEAPEFAQKIFAKEQVEDHEDESKRQIDELTTQVATLTKQVKSLENKLSDAQKQASRESAINIGKAQNSNIKENKLAHASNTPNDLSTLSQDIEPLNLKASTTHYKPSEQEKRIEQQAILRELARKMEMASLSSLPAR